MKNDKLTINMIKNAIISIHDNCLKSKKSLLDTMLFIYKDICCDDEDLIGEILYYRLLEEFDTIIEMNKGEEE